MILGRCWRLFGALGCSWGGPERNFHQAELRIAPASLPCPFWSILGGRFGVQFGSQSNKNIKNYILMWPLRHLDDFVLSIIVFKVAFSFEEAPQYDGNFDGTYLPLFDELRIYFMFS